MFKFSFEMIDYQNNDPFPEKLTSLIENIYGEINKQTFTDNSAIIEFSSNVKKIEKLIQDRFNMNVVFDKKLHVFASAAIIPFFSDYLADVHSIRNLTEFLFGYQDTIKHIQQLEKEKKQYLNRIHNKKGYINFKHARLSGYLSEVKHYLLFDFIYLKNAGLEPSELTAIMLHELGHAFTGLESHHRLETTNATIMDILNDLNENKTEKALYTYKKHFSQSEFDQASVNTQKEIQDFNGQLAMTYLGEIKSQFINNKYDETNFENLADSFAVRFGCGKDIASALNKLYRLGSTVYYDSRGLYVCMFILDILVMGSLLYLLGPVGGSIFLLIVLTLFSDRVMTYDFPIERYNRIKNGIVNQLKNPKLPPTIQKDLLNQYYFMEEIAEKSQHFKGSLDWIIDYLSPVRREDNYYIHIQQTVENSLNNALFVKSVELKTL